jgi:hypothetical protein
MYVVGSAVPATYMDMTMDGNSSSAFWSEYSAMLPKGRWNTSTMPLDRFGDSYMYAGNGVQLPPQVHANRLVTRVERNACAIAPESRLANEYLLNQSWQQRRSIWGWNQSWAKFPDKIDKQAFLSPADVLLNSVNVLDPACHQSTLQLPCEHNLTAGNKSARLSVYKKKVVIPVAVQDQDEDVQEFAFPHRECVSMWGCSTMVEFRRAPLVQCAQPACSFSGTTVLVADISMSFFHFMHDSLGKILCLHSYYRKQHMLDPEEEIRIIYANADPNADAIVNKPPAQIHFFAALSRFPIIYLPATPVCARFERLIVSGGKGGAPKSHCSSLWGLVKTAASKAYGLPTGSNGMRYYGDPQLTFNVRVGRSHGQLARRVINARAAVAAINQINLSRYPMRVVTFDSYPAYMQLQIIASTDVLVGVHGAGQTLAMFLPPCAVNIEMFAYGGGGPRPGAYAAPHAPYKSWEDDACPPQLSCWDQPGCAPSPDCRPRDNRSNSRDLHLNISKFVQMIHEAVATRANCLNRSALKSKAPTSKAPTSKGHNSSMWKWPTSKAASPKAPTSKGCRTYRTCHTRHHSQPLTPTHRTPHMRCAPCVHELAHTIGLSSSHHSSRP